MALNNNYERPTIIKHHVGFMNKFGLKTDNKPITHIDDVAVEKIIKQYGSPCFVISEKQIRTTVTEANSSFKTRYPKVQFAWSYKTNYIDAVCNIFHQEGAWAEVVSGFEYDKAIKNGVPGSKIIFNGPDKSVDDLKKAIDNESYIHIDHLDELYLLSELLYTIKKKTKVAIRINMDAGIYPLWDRFGFNYENGQAWHAITKICLNPFMELVGLHCHIGTYIYTTEPYVIAVKKLSELAFRYKNTYQKNIQYLDLGGGFASKNTLRGAYLQGIDSTPSIDDYAQAITTTLLSVGFEHQHLPLLILETGRALIDDAGWLLGSVLALKRLSDGRRATILDFGVNVLFTSFWYNHKISPAQHHSHQSEDMALYGPLCMNIDVVRENVNLPLLNKGDAVVVHRVGAYNMTQWMQFIHMRPNVVLIDSNGNTHIIRKAENLDTILQQELLPDHLKTTFK